MRSNPSPSYQPMNFGRPARTVVTVEDKETHDPLLGATVSIVSRADTLRGTTVKEDFYRIMAVYRCDRIFRDSVDLEVTYVGYKPFKKRYGNTGFRGRIEVKMEVDEQSIAQVVVVGQQVAMVFRGDTTVYNAGAFKTMADDRFAELLKQPAGRRDQGQQDLRRRAGGQTGADRREKPLRLENLLRTHRPRSLGRPERAGLRGFQPRGKAPGGQHGRKREGDGRRNQVEARLHPGRESGGNARREPRKGLLGSA